MDFLFYLLGSRGHKLHGTRPILSEYFYAKIFRKKMELAGSLFKNFLSTLDVRTSHTFRGPVLIFVTLISYHIDARV